MKTDRLFYVKNKDVCKKVKIISNKYIKYTEQYYRHGLD